MSSIPDMEYVNRHMYEEFMALCHVARKSVRLCAPFVKCDIVRDVVSNVKSDVRLELITNINFRAFHQKASDIDALREIITVNGQVYNCTTLHAKFYLFDDAKCLVTSANLTSSGLKRKLERGVLSSDKYFVNSASKDFEEIKSHKDVGKISIENIDVIEQLLNGLPAPQKIHYPDLEYPMTFEGDINALRNGLSGWKLKVFNLLNDLSDDIFDSRTVQDIAENLGRVYPHNKNRSAKVRQILQQLRDFGLIEFVEPGKYRRLWLGGDLLATTK